MVCIPKDLVFRYDFERPPGVGMLGTQAAPDEQSPWNQAQRGSVVLAQSKCTGHKSYGIPLSVPSEHVLASAA
eukprot:2292857-Amphidinium_carterae.1